MSEEKKQNNLKQTNHPPHTHTHKKPIKQKETTTPTNQTPHPRHTSQKQGYP